MMDELRRSSAHVFVEDISHPVLTDSDVHDVSRVLRLKNGEVVSCSDGHGAWIVVTTIGGAAANTVIRGAAKFSAPDDDRRIQ